MPGKPSAALAKAGNRRRASSQIAALIATHNLELAHRLDRILALEDGRLRPAA